MALLVFDFDGTLVDSNAVKRRAYWDAAAGFDGAAAILDRLFTAPDAGDRRQVTMHLAQALGRPALAGELADRYTAITRDAILARLADGWAAGFLGALRGRGHRLYVSSATPCDALADILSSGGLDVLLDGQRGGYGRKVENLRGILAAENAAEAVVIGDGRDDADAAVACACIYIRVDDGAGGLFRRTVPAAVDWLEAQAAAYLNAKSS